MASIAALDEKGKEFHHILKSGRTHMMDAVPMRLGQEFTAYAGRDKTRQEIHPAAVGAAARNGPRWLGGRHRHQHPSRLSRESRSPIWRASPARSSRRWTTCAMPCSPTWRCRRSARHLRNLALEVIRISNDLRLLSSGPNTGLAEINLPALQPGSSIMPGKINPVMAELAAMVSFQVSATTLRSRWRCRPANSNSTS